MQTAVARKQEENKITGPASAPSAEPHVDLKTENTPRAASTPYSKGSQSSKKRNFRQNQNLGIYLMLIPLSNPKSSPLRD